MRFHNRIDAAHQLIPLLEKFKQEACVVLAVPRGGVPIGYEIAAHFRFPLDILLAKKIGHPASSELAIGAVSLEDAVIDDRHGITDSYIQGEIMKIRQRLMERQKKFLGDRQPVSLKGKTVIITDDGIATGHTLLAAIKLIRTQQPKKIVIAVPVAPIRAAQKIQTVVDDFICLHTPYDFFGVGQFYHDFSQVSDEEVISLLALALPLGS
jgi:predicted phosphoribosyltransferase